MVVCAGRSGQPSLSWSLRLRIVKGAARGLAHLHECSPRRFVHGEVKPSNILLDADFTPRIADFGLARLLAVAGCAPDGPPSAGGGGLLGGAIPYAKPAGPAPDRYGGGYRAPEARAPGAKPSQKWDVFAFGVVLLEAVTGREPTEGEGGMDLEAWVRRAFKEERPLSEVVDPTLLGEVHAKKQVLAVFHVALGCTEPDPEMRPRMRAVAESLDRIG